MSVVRCDNIVRRGWRDAPSIMRAGSFLQARRGVCCENTGDFTCGITATIVLMMA